jgi:hypothetical protein
MLVLGPGESCARFDRLELSLPAMQKDFPRPDSGVFLIGRLGARGLR